MPNKTATDFRTKTSDELETQLEELSKEQFNLRCLLYTSDAADE